MEDLEDGGPLKATTYLDAAGGPTRVKWRRCPSEDGGPLKMEEPWPKLQARIKKYCGSAAKMDRIGKWSIQPAAGAIAA